MSDPTIPPAAGPKPDAEGPKPVPERADGRKANAVRKVQIIRGAARLADGSAWIRLGNTQVLCTVTVDDRLPNWMRGTKGQGWITAEYGMLPRAVPERAARGRVSGRSFEIQRLIGRCLRAAVDLRAVGERLITVDCDVLDADGGTRVASITGGWVALYDCFERMRAAKQIRHDPLKGRIAAVSVGLVDGAGLLDLCHSEDSRAQVDLNIVGTLDGKLVEIQGAAEGEPFEESDVRQLIKIARRGLATMFRAQEKAIAAPGRPGIDLPQQP
jgi:ribonuclease PH